MKKEIGLTIIVVVGLLLITSNFWWPFGKDDYELKLTDTIQTIELDLAGVDAVIIPEKRETVRVSLSGKGYIELDESRNKIEIDYKRKWFERFGFGKTELKVYIPSDYDQSLDIDLGSGSVQLGQGTDGGLHLEKLMIDIGSGDLFLDSISAEEANFDVSSGEVEITNYTGPVHADVSSGDLKIQVNELKHDIEVELSSGFVSLDLPENADFTLDGKMMSGEISNHFELIDEKEDKDRIQGKHGTGKHHIKIDVSSGHVEIH